MKGLTSSDSHTNSEAIAKADEYLERSRKEKEEERKGGREGGGAAGMVVQDRTVINRGQESSTPSDESRELRLASQVLQINCCPKIKFCGRVLERCHEVISIHDHASLVPRPHPAFCHF